MDLSGDRTSRAITLGQCLWQSLLKLKANGDLFEARTIKNHSEWIRQASVEECLSSSRPEDMREALKLHNRSEWSRQAKVLKYSVSNAIRDY